jgi:hypothetical protein
MDFTCKHQLFLAEENFDFFEDVTPPLLLRALLRVFHATDDRSCF